LRAGLLHATPHYVRAARPELARGVSRNTFAVFMQPDVSFVMRPPRGLTAAAAAAHAAGGGAASPSKLTAAEASQWRPGMSFGAFASAVMGQYYDAARRQADAAGRGACGARQTVVLHAEAE
jgi:hypothetical protein